jgi:phage terminase large subunit GpA-like protein
MDVGADYEHEMVTVIGPSQWGKTAVMGNILGRMIHIDPGPAMVVHPTISAGQKWSKTRFSTMVRDCPVLWDLVADAKSRTSSNTILEKAFRGGLLINVGANAPGGLAAQPVRYLYFEEIDRVPLDKSAGKEGDYEALAIARTTDENFIRTRKIYRSTSPTIEGASRGERAWNESDKRYWFFRCPHCGHEQRLFWENVIFDEKSLDLEHLVYACSGGGCPISQAELTPAVRKGHWIATRPEIRNHAGFWIHGLQVRSMAYIVAEFIKARKGGTQLLQTWKNTCLGVLWSPKDGDVAQVEGLQARARESGYISGQVPDGVGLLVGSIDVQDDRLEMLIYGVGAGEESWRILREVIHGNLATSEPWDRAEAFLTQDWPRISGGSLRVRGTSVDMGGHFAKHVYAFCRRPALKGRAWAIKGATTAQAKLVRRSGSKARLYLIDTVTAKDDLHGRLKILNPGPGHCHFPEDIGAEYFEQLLAERPVSKDGRRAYKKITEDARNEALDLEVYAQGALAIFAPRDLEALVEKAQALAGSPSPAVPVGIREVPEPQVGDGEDPQENPEPQAPKPLPGAPAIRVIGSKSPRGTGIVGSGGFGGRGGRGGPSGAW